MVTSTSPLTPVAPGAPTDAGSAGMQPRWTVDLLDGLPQPLEDKRYEVIDGELYVTTQPHRHHQRTCANVTFELESWSRSTDAGITTVAPGIIFARDEAVAPDVTWVSKERYEAISADDGKFHAAPELVVEVLSAGTENERRDREVKLAIYSRRGVQEYWILDWRRRAVDIYRREQGMLRHAVALLPDETLESPLLAGFTCPVARLFTGIS